MGVVQRIDSMVALVLLLLGSLVQIAAGYNAIGVCYGMVADNLPPATEVVAMYKTMNITRMRLYNPNVDALEALRGSNISLLLGVPNELLQSLAGDQSAAADWVHTNIHAYSGNVMFRYIAVGNEVIPGDLAQYVFPAMQNIQVALSAAGMNNTKVSTSVDMAVLGTSYPPSAGAFSLDAQPIVVPIVQFLRSIGAPLLVNVYPYFAYAGNNDGGIALDYALFTKKETAMSDNNELRYQNLFDAMVDAIYSALENVGGADVPLVVSETGWPSAGGDAATVENAQIYNQNLIKHVCSGTPKRPGELETYIFSMFNEDLKQPQGVENNWGLFYPSQQPVYPIKF